MQPSEACFTHAQWHLHPLGTTRDTSLYSPHLEAPLFLDVCSTGTVTESKYSGSLIFRCSQQGSYSIQCLTCWGQAIRKPIPSLSLIPIPCFHCAWPKAYFVLSYRVSKTPEICSYDGPCTWSLPISLSYTSFSGEGGKCRGSVGNILCCVSGGYSVFPGGCSMSSAASVIPFPLWPAHIHTDTARQEQPSLLSKVCRVQLSLPKRRGGQHFSLLLSQKSVSGLLDLSPE